MKEQTCSDLIETKFMDYGCLHMSRMKLVIEPSAAVGVHNIRFPYLFTTTVDVPYALGHAHVCYNCLKCYSLFTVNNE